ncbi:MAG: transporter substrate-binding domain-containing protein [Rhodocyclaceae bacterium]|nr:transporter substrate-binding domain-containing protein [Rhodocyclaceae bacterium]
MIRALLCLLACLLPLSGPAAATETLVLCLENNDVRPWRTQDGGGLNIELLNRVAARLDLRFEYRGMPWKRCLAELKADQVSGAIGASFRPERLEFGVYPGGDKPDASKRLNSDRYVLLRRKNSRVSWDGRAFRNLDGPVGIQLGYSVGDQLRALGATVDDGAQKAVELAQKLAAGRLGAAAMLDGEARTLMEQNPTLAKQLETLPTPLVEKSYFLMFSHNFADLRGSVAMHVWKEVEAVRNSKDYQKQEREALRGIRP